jgi:hypothetical protein
MDMEVKLIFCFILFSILKRFLEVHLYEKYFLEHKVEVTDIQIQTVCSTIFCVYVSAFILKAILIFSEHPLEKELQIYFQYMQQTKAAIINLF